MIGCGNPEAGDDAVGLLVVRAARPRLEKLPGVEVVEAGPALNVVHLLEGVDGAVVVDAVRTHRGGRAVGTVIRIEAGPEGLPADLGASLSSHGFGLAEAIGLVAVLHEAPRVVVLGVEVSDVTAGHALSAPVAVVLPDLVERLVTEVEELRKDSPRP